MDESTFFASRSVPVHLVRGVVGAVLVVLGIALAGSSPLFLLLLVPAGVAWRGCPTCWALGLTQTIARGKLERVCVEDRCTLERV